MGLSVAVLFAKCTRDRQGFGMRLEKSGSNEWTITWKFAIKEKTAQKEGYVSRRLEGRFVSSPLDPGCPHCKSKGFFKCGNCAKLTCWNEKDKTVVCAWCSNQGELSGEITELDSSSDR